jgi:hypothetical protein
MTNPHLVQLVLPRGDAAFLMQRLQRLAVHSRQRSDYMKRPMTRAAAKVEVALYERLVNDLRVALGGT